MMQRMLNVPQKADGKIITHQELSSIIDVGAETGVLDAAREQMLMSSLHLHNVPIKALMTPRKDIYALDANCSTAECLQEAMNRPHSRYPVYHGQQDHIIGIVHLRDLVKFRHNKGPLLDVMIWREVPYAPANKNALQQLFDFQNHRQHLAIVVDEYGDIDGLISMEDILEEIVGEIEDESDTPTVSNMWPQPDGSVVAAGTVNLHDINQELDLELPEEGATTLGGLIVERIGAQPEARMCLVVNGVRLEISELDGNWIRRVRISESESED
jgi:CBS domain containing-hemolysin-like protein